LCGLSKRGGWFVRKVRVGINGYGVIGKRAADAVAVQDDMEVAGVTFNHFDYRIRVAEEKGYPVYACSSEGLAAGASEGAHVVGTLENMLGRVDVVVDCTAKGVGTANRLLYEKAGVKAIFQGGEPHDIAGVSFTAQVNYSEALNRQFVRVVSCNTTALCRVMNALHKRGWVKKARAVLVRRASDPGDSHKGSLMNTVVPETRVPSHQGTDARTVISGLNITTMAGTASHTLSHMHYAMVETTRPLTLKEVKDAFWQEPRIAFVRAGDGLVGLNSVMELMRDLGRPRNDLWEVALWEDALAVDGNEIYTVFQVHNEAVTIPEIVDAIRALTGIEGDPLKSIEKTNRTMGILKTFLPRTMPATDKQTAAICAAEESRDCSEPDTAAFMRAPTG
jgi:glyceraldehyde-3-phosphate dehydrogenase (NAD(P))